MHHCCSTQKHPHNPASCVCPNLLSKAGKIRLLEEELEIMEDKTGAIKTLIEELKAEQ